MLKEGSKAPVFCLDGIDTDGQESSFCLKDILKSGKDLVLYFYPRDNTPGCTTEACDFRDNAARITGKAAVIGISPDSITSHLNFRNKYQLSFPLLCDPEKEVLQKYGAWGEKKSYGKTSMGVIRSTFIIGKDGIIKKIWRNVKAGGHVDQVMSAL